MDFFKRDMRETQVKDTKLVGAVVPTNIFYYLNLFCVVDKRSKSSILRPMVEDWYLSASKDFSEKKLIKLAIEMGYESWLNRKTKRRPFPVVLKQQERELLKKGVDAKTVAKIIEKIEAKYRRATSEAKIKRIIKKNQKIKQQQNGESN